MLIIKALLENGVSKFTLLLFGLLSLSRFEHQFEIGRTLLDFGYGEWYPYRLFYPIKVGVFMV